MIEQTEPRRTQSHVGKNIAGSLVPRPRRSRSTALGRFVVARGERYCDPKFSELYRPILRRVRHWL
ncbi:MAG: hypothetical protein ACKVSF_13935 [Alphaproteobacteria bacterium]